MERASLAEFAFDPDCPLLHFYQLLTDGQAQACSFAHADRGEADLVELLEDMCAFFGSNAEAGIGHRNSYSVPFDDGIDKNFAAGLGEFGSIAEEVVEDLAKPHGVCEDVAVDVITHANGDGSRLRVGPDGRDGFADDFGENDWLGTKVKAACLNAAEVEDIIDQAQQVFGIDVNVVEKPLLFGIERTFSFFCEELGETDDGVERGAKFVADAGHEFAFELVEALGFLVPCFELGHVAFLQSADALLRELSVGYVANDGGDVDAVFGIDGAQANFYREPGAILALREEIQS